MRSTSISNSGRDKPVISFKRAMKTLSRDDRFHATAYAMNTILVQKGIYSLKEFELHFRQFAQKQRRKKM